MKLYAVRFILPALLATLASSVTLAESPTGTEKGRFSSTSDIITVLENDRASASDTISALRALRGEYLAEGPRAIPSMLALLRKPNRKDCSQWECMGSDLRGPVLEALGAMGAAAAPAVSELAMWLEVAVGLRLDVEPPVDPNVLRSCKGSSHCARQFLKVLEAIGPGAAKAVPVLIAVVRENAGHPGTNDFREDEFRVLGAIGPEAADAVPLLLATALEGAPNGRFVSTAIESLSRIAPRNPDVFAITARALTRPRSLGLYNASYHEMVDRVFRAYPTFSEPEIRVLALEIREGLRDESRYLLLNARSMRLVCGILARHPEFAAISVPILAEIIGAYPSDGAVEGLGIVIETAGGFGPKAADAVPALAEKALDSGGSVYREQAAAALRAIASEEANLAIADYAARRWRRLR